MGIQYIFNVPIAAAVDNGLNNNFQIFGKLISLISVFLLIIFAAYFTARFMGKRGTAIAGNKNLKIIEKMYLGVDKALYIIAVGDIYYLIAMTKNSVELIDRIDKEQIRLISQEIENSQFSKPFNTYLAKLLHGDKNRTEVENLTQNHFDIKNDLLGRLDKIKDRNTTINKLRDKDEENED